MKQSARIAFSFSILFALSVPASVFAAAAPPPPAPTVNVTDTCTVVDTDGTSHTYDQSGQFLGICALAAAKDQGAVSDYTLQNFSFGLFLQTLNGTAPSATQFWNLYQNGTESSVGLSDLIISTGDLLKFQLTDFTDSSQIGSPVTFQIGTLTATPAPTPAPSSGSGGGGLTLHAPFDVPLALAFIAYMQHADGSFDSLLLSDWAAIAFAGGGAGDAQRKLAQYFTANPPVLESVTDYERHAMALEALGIDPYSGTATNYIAPIVDAFDGTQVGDPSLVNDDVFALFPILHAGFGVSDDVVAKTTAFIISKQLADGSWENSVDLSAAAIQALSLVRSLPEASDAITHGLNYIHRQQKIDGSLGNSFSTSWALQAIAAVPNSSLSWAQDYRTPQYYLATKQETDGGVEPPATDAKTRLWATVYAVPGIKGKTWDALLASFAKPAPAPILTVATSTPEVTTSMAPADTIIPVPVPPTTPAPVVATQPDEPIVERSAEPATGTSTPEALSQVAAAATVEGVSTFWMYATWVLLFLILAGVLGERWWRKRRERNS